MSNFIVLCKMFGNLGIYVFHTPKSFYKQTNEKRNPLKNRHKECGLIQGLMSPGPLQALQKIWYEKNKKDKETIRI